MSDLIRRQDAIDACRSVVDNINSPTDQQIGAEYCLDLIKEIPSAEPELEKGKWIFHIDDLFPEESTQECSVCHEEESIKIQNDNFCPNCGATMRLQNT